MSETAAAISAEPTKLGRPPVPIETRFYKQFMPEPNSGCWIWTGAICGRGYGAIKDGKRIMRRASRVSWELHRGSIPDRMCVCHHCDVPLCVNPNHLFLGTNADNTRDMIRKNRHSWSGLVAGAKLSAAQAFAIKYSTLKGVALAKQYSISASMVSNIKSGRRWGHL